MQNWVHPIASDESSSNSLDPAHLGFIDDALRAQRWMPAIPVALRQNYEAEAGVQRRIGNRRVLLLLTVLFDLFCTTQAQTAPDIFVLSCALRLGLFTPAVVLFLLLERAGRLGRFYEPGLLVLAVLPAAITAWLCLATMEPLAQPEIYGTPLILLYTGVLLRMKLPNAVANAGCCSLIYAYSIMTCPMLPHDQTATLIFIQLVIATAVVTFNVQLETRDRRVFLLTSNERIRRALVVAQNSGLLRETQTDALTGLANRRCFDETASVRWLEALQTGTPIGMIMIDVDYFKAFNDHFGHTVGDDCLRRIGAQLAASARKGDVVARYGGEEFAVIMSDVTLQDAAFAAERMRASISGLGLPHVAPRPGATVTVSLGCATTRPEHAHGVRKLIETADRNLYAAKRAGRNRLATAAATDGGDAEVAATVK